MKPPLILFILVVVLVVEVESLGQGTVPTIGQCQAVCLKEYTTRKEFISLAGTPYVDFDVTNNTDFSLCKLGCNSPDFNDLALPAFRRGQMTFRDVINNGNKAPLTTSPISSLRLLCADSYQNSTTFGKLLLDIRNASSADYLVHHVEGVRKEPGKETETIFMSAWAYIPLVDFIATFPPSDHLVQFRVTSFNTEGLMGAAARTAWIESQIVANAAHSALFVKESKIIWREDAAAAQLSISAEQVPACSLSLSFTMDDGANQKIEFEMDRTSGFLLERLKFDKTYTLHVEPAQVTTTPATISLTIPSCLQLVDNPTMCAPSEVTDFEWKWNSTKSEGNTVLLSWSFGPNKEAVSAKRETSHSRLVHFDVSLKPFGNDPICRGIDPQSRVITATHRSVSLFIPDERCQYEAEITVVDWKNRRSRTTRAVVSKHEQPKGGVLALTAQWNVEMFILVGFLFALILAATGMAVCRFRDRHDFNTLKKEHRQLTKNIIVAQSASTLPRSQCLTIVDGRGRPISSDDSEMSVPIQPFSPGILQNKNFIDEGVYDSLDTPSRSEVGVHFDRPSNASFHRANPIYAGINVHGIMTIPIDRLNVTTYVRNQSKSWISANVIDGDGAAYCMKYSSEDSSALRQELGIVSRVSTDHPFLIYFHGLAVRDSQALALLFEPARGGTLSGFLSDARDALSHDTASRCSSGYDGSDHSQDSLDHFQRQIDRLTAHLYAFARQISGGLSFLHAQHCSHGSLSTESVHLLKTYKDPLKLPCDQIVKIGDYETARLEGSPETVLQLPSSLTPPEVLSGKSHGSAGDLWQMGLLICDLVSLGSVISLWESCAGNLTDKAVKNYYSRLSTGHDLSNRIDPGLVQLKQLAPKCLTIEAKKRICARELERALTSIQPKSHSYKEHSESIEV